MSNMLYYDELSAEGFIRVKSSEYEELKKKNEELTKTVNEYSITIKLLEGQCNNLTIETLRLNSIVNTIQALVGPRKF